MMFEIRKEKKNDLGKIKFYNSTSVIDTLEHQKALKEIL